jgi:hypothetical protein
MGNGLIMEDHSPASHFSAFVTLVLPIAGIEMYQFGLASKGIISAADLVKIRLASPELLLFEEQMDEQREFSVRSAWKQTR